MKHNFVKLINFLVNLIKADWDKQNSITFSKIFSFQIFNFQKFSTVLPWNQPIIKFLSRSVNMLNNSSRSQEEQELTIQDNDPCFRFPVFQSENVPKFIIVFNCAINVPLLITTIIGNALVLAAVWKSPSLRSPSVIFLCGLATTDLAVGLLLQPLFLSMELILLSNSSTYHCALGYAFITVSYTVCGASLVTLATISVDRLLSLRYHMRYASIVTVRRALCAITLNWLTSAFLASLILWSPNIVFLTVMAIAVAIFLCLSTSVHLCIYRIIRRHKQQIVAQLQAVQDGSCVNVTRFKKSAATAFFVHYFLVICYTPLFVTLMLTANEERQSSEAWGENGSAIAWKLTSTIVFMNSALNPFIYCWRLREIRNAVKKVFFCRK